MELSPDKNGTAHFSSVCTQVPQQTCELVAVMARKVCGGRPDMPFPEANSGQVMIFHR